MRTAGLVAAAAVVVAAGLNAAPRQIAVENGTGLEFVHVVPQPVTYLGKKALRLVETSERYAGEAVALVSDTNFGDGTLEVEVAGKPGAGSDTAARGFVGLAFRST